MAVQTHVIVVTTSRDAQTDRSGPLIVERLKQAGHTCTGPELVPDMASDIGAAIDRAMDQQETRCVILSGGTGPSPSDVTADVVEQRLTRSLPGFGELFRMLSFQDIGAAAMLSRAIGGLANNTLIFALPGSPKACTLGMNELILPNLSHLVHQMDRDEPAGGGADHGPHTPGLSIAQTGQGALPDASPTPEAHGWMAALKALNAQLDGDKWPTLPEPIQANVAARSVFERAGQCGVITTGDGQQFAAYGFPDLLRPTSKVLITGNGGRSDYVVALHRYPESVGILGHGAPLLPAPGTPVGPAAEVRFGTQPDPTGPLFAIEPAQVFFEHADAIVSYDGRQAEHEGTPKQVGATLVLRWSHQ